MDGPTEYRLYRENRPAWVAYAAPRWRKLLKAAEPAERSRLWDSAGEDLQDAIRGRTTEAARA